MLRGLGSLALVLATAGIASAQYPNYPTGGGYPSPPNFGARQPQSPLSPYLNLLNSGGLYPAANYYNLTRPFLQQPSPFAAQPGMIPQAGAFQQQMGFLRAPALPPVTVPDPFDPTSDGSTLPPTGHPVTFGNRGAGSPAVRGGFLPTGTQPQQPSARPGQPPQTMPRAKK